MGKNDVTEKLTSRYVLFSCEGTAEAVVMDNL